MLPWHPRIYARL
jgi:hypothetical protein